MHASGQITEPSQAKSATWVSIDHTRVHTPCPSEGTDGIFPFSNEARHKATNAMNGPPEGRIAYADRETCVVVSIALPADLTVTWGMIGRILYSLIDRNKKRWVACGIVLFPWMVSLKARPLEGRQRNKNAPTALF